MKVSPNVESFFEYQTLTASGSESQAPIFEFRTIETQVLIPNANTLVMGGMVKDNPNDPGTKVPLLGDIPYLGVAFRSDEGGGQGKSADFHHAHDPPGLGFSSDNHGFPAGSTGTKPETLNPNSVWDSSKPHNWSDPENTDPNQKVLNQQATR